MNKVWINTEKGEDKVIGIGNGLIYKVNPKQDKVDSYVAKIEQNTPSEDILTIPFSYLREIQYQEGKKYIQVFFGRESEEHIRIADDTKRYEVFKYFKENIPHVTYSFETYSALKSGKKPLIALMVTSLLFLVTLYFAIQIELGYDYDIVGNGKSIINIILALAYLGVFKVVLIFGSLMSIALFSMIRKMKNRPTVHALAVLR